MTKRELLRKALEFEDNLDSPATIRLVRRDGHGCATFTKTVEIVRVHSGQFAVEEEDFDSAQWKPT